MSKYFFLFFSFAFYLVSCKTNEGLTKENNPNIELSQDKGQAEIQEKEDIPTDLISLYKALGFSEEDKGAFTSIYKKHNRRIHGISSSYIAENEKTLAIARIKRERDVEVGKMLNFEQKKIYRKYIKLRKTIEVENKDSKTKKF